MACTKGPVHGPVCNKVITNQNNSKNQQKNTQPKQNTATLSGQLRQYAVASLLAYVTVQGVHRRFVHNCA